MGRRPTEKRGSCEGGSSSCFCPGCCCSGHIEEELSHARSWSPESGNFMKVSGSHSCATAHTSAARRRRRGQAEDAVRAVRVLSLVQGRGTPRARDPGPPIPRRTLSEEVRVAELAEPFVLDSMELFVCFRNARRGEAAGPSGMTSDHLFPVLDSEGDSESCAKVVSMLAVANVPYEIIEAIRLRLLTVREVKEFRVSSLSSEAEQRRFAMTIA